MISGTVNHVKFKRLARELKLAEWQCVGILESIWMFTAKSHICGDIGTSDNIDIAIGIGWNDDEDELINALVKSKWVDECRTHRLVIHDWHIHCPNHVKGNVKKYGKSFASEKITPKDAPCETPREVPSDAPIGGSLEDAPTKPSQFKPIQAKPDQVTYTLPEKPLKKDFYECYNTDKEQLWKYFVANTNCLTELNFNYVTFMNMDRSYPASPAWSVVDQIQKAMLGVELDNPKRAGSYIAKIWAGLEKEEKQKGGNK